MKKIILLLFLLQFTVSFAQGTKINSNELEKIKNEVINNSNAWENLKTFCFNYGARLMWSPQYKKSAEWLADKLKEYGIPKVYFEDINHTGKSWTLKKYYANLKEPYTFPIVGNPKEWTPGTNGLIKSEVIYLNAKSEADFEKYKGKLKGKIVFISDPIMLRPYTSPLFVRFSDDSLKALSNLTIKTPDEKLQEKENEEKGMQAYLEYAKFITKKVEFCKNEGAALLVDEGHRFYGLSQIWANIMTVQPKDVYDYLSKYAGEPDFPESLPQITISVEQYNTILGALERGAHVVMEADVEVENSGVEKGFNVIAEIPGNEFKDEVVILGAHLDSYPFANGAADNGTGVISCVEAMRVLKTLGLQPKRTIRIGLWGGEEEEYLGSGSHIKQHFKGGNEKCFSYFNMDFGVGRFRGIYAEENPGAANLFKEWMKMIDDPKFQTVCLSRMKNSDQEAFNNAGLAGFQFIQDPLDYWKIYHTNMDFVDRIPRDDLINDSYLMAAFAWLSANYEGEFPAK